MKAGWRVRLTQLFGAKPARAAVIAAPRKVKVKWEELVKQLYKGPKPATDFTKDEIVGGNVWMMQADRPMKPQGPSMLFIEVHTTGVKARSLSHDNEKACWGVLIEDNSFWVSARSNNGVR